MGDGLGGAANGRGQLNPMVAVQGQVFLIAHGGSSPDLSTSSMNQAESVMYAGSTTGPSHNNEICSPFAITWHVDLPCPVVTPEAFDRLCRKMKTDWQMEKDLYPHGSRKILLPKSVVESRYVVPLA